MEDNCLAVAPSASVCGVYESSQHGFAAAGFPSYSSMSSESRFGGGRGGGRCGAQIQPPS